MTTRASGPAPMAITRGEWLVLAFTLAYVSVFGAVFTRAGNAEFVWYVVTLIALVAIVGFGQRSARFPPAILWALSIWGLAHMAGGGVPLEGRVLYAHTVFPLFASDAYVFLRYDQIVHFYGFGVAAWVLRHLLRRHFPTLEGTKSLVAFPVLGAMGLGALNEMIEFAAVAMFPETNVGGYVNTALDLVFNAAGAVFAMILVSVFQPHESRTRRSR